MIVWEHRDRLMLKALTVENYRGFREKTVFELKPLTVLLGRNSSGKSSLTRLIPLFQQSLTRSSASPVLWSSDAVDMGNICDVITHNDDPLELRIGFRIPVGALAHFLSRYQFGPPPQLYLDQDEEVEYVIRLSADGARTKFDGIDITIAGQVLSIGWSKEGVVNKIAVDGKPYKVGDDELIVEPASMFPEITRKRRREGDVRRRYAGLMSEELSTALDPVIHGRTAKDRVKHLSDTIAFLPKRSARTAVRELPNVVARKVTEANSARISDLSFIHNASKIVTFLQFELTPTFMSAAYIGPSRASGNRFDRIQELAVNRLDASGANTAMYVYSLNEQERSSFNDLLIRACGHTLKVDESGVGHVSVKIGRLGQAHFENITDVGFGYSQLVPVIAQLHAVRERALGSDEAETRDVIFAVEQPELHLHPAMQASLADLFVGAINTETSLVDSTTIIVETHSETFISQLGLLVAEKAIEPSSIAIYFVDKDENEELSRLRRVDFNADGVIEEWPAGFFSAI